MVSLDRIETGIARYLDNVLAPQLPLAGRYDPLKKTAFLTGAMYMVRHSRSAVEDFLKKPFVASMGIMDDGGNIDLDGVVEALKSNIPESGLRVPVPVIGELVFYGPDVDEIARYIKGG